MRYFFDFDRTIFDTPTFKQAFEARPERAALLAQFKAVIRELRHPAVTGSRFESRRRTFMRTLGTYLSHGRFIFTPEELKGFLYPDAVAFFLEHGKESTIVTYGVKAFIMAKVTNALTDLPDVQIVYTKRKKGRTIRKLCRESDGPFVFVDDAHFQLESVAKVNPHVRVIEMRRDKGKGDGRWPVIHSLVELPGVLARTAAQFEEPMP